MFNPAILVLADGSTFYGKSIGYQAVSAYSIGEVVFNTAMTGYQEILTDPSYAKQIVTLTYPHIGNTGTNDEDNESNQIYASGLIIRDLPLLHSNFRATSSLSDYLIQHNIIAIADIDTRRLTRILRETGSQAGCIYIPNENESLAQAVEKAQDLAKSFGSMAGKDLAKEVTCQHRYEWQEGIWHLPTNNAGKPFNLQTTPTFHVVAYDFGIKQNILRMLAERGCKITVVPAQTSAEDILALNPDGIFLSNGPGDPEPCTYAIQSIRQLLNTQKPIFGICLGHQLLGLAVGAKTRKMAFGHHGANHPVQDLKTEHVLITSQNHGFEIDEYSLPENVIVTHRSLFDNSVQGIELTNQVAFSFQGHPEANPGPQDVAYLFDKFINAVQATKA
ncbi:carbamoyl-phosphate synthase small subunit [[Haemophilus] ducreyi]|uniref:Carbamoyl phosphate synthase small chain n=2 Tax=Haemophilus ducreyi TaxID=730 RepID=CARA_HAEDU|nr:glutamine-hydrolyzing carbamoyl-phosphate synthase small subunit [[Haemophilus] ducreyi]Q7VP66.1 RecName: Full=Carbamoyl phosphate synthase small chain; AltName: Full=Carbamoyl phosphate synthetase glutamine chain [[Haemophilus] ducreyi 35000HP]AAP95221.1 carbamoyl-phosphate synthase, small subunit [[Haemophilus] ducreyi 35000HP]AKO30370.1 carbamoyl-phosphate synthase [[Haemophilus] ducreyi]AKO31803.1 carbamoyl-phosphate synthase [[Haemophilus] ducreyi]AKO33255.1 carbamoyl-phosphate synthas